MGRPSKPIISRERAARAALEVIDARGLEEFSLGAVARRLKVKAPSFYYHFSDKAELLREVARQLLLEVRYPEASVGTWEDQVTALCVATRRALLRHPQAAPLLLQFFPRQLLLGSYDSAVKGYPVSQSLHMAILEGLEKLTLGSALFEAAAHTQKKELMPKVDSALYPALAQSVAANAFDNEQLFVEAVRMFLSGVKGRANREGQKAPLVAKEVNRVRRQLRERRASTL